MGCSSSAGLSFGFVLGGPSAKSDLYLPRCRPEGEVDVFSRHDLIFPWNSRREIAAGSKSRSEAVRHASRRAWHWGTSFVVMVCCPARICSLRSPLACQLSESLIGGSVKGVPCACPK